jgi:ketosteroid isomerase-like protein
MTMMSRDCGKVIAESVQEERGDGKMVEEVRKAIENVKLKYVEGIRRGDAAAMAANFTDDVILLPPNSEIIRGRKGVEKLFEASLQGGLKDEVFTTMELSGSGNTIYEICKFTTRFVRERQKPVEQKGTYLCIWKHTASGWKIHRHIWNFA